MNTCAKVLLAAACLVSMAVAAPKAKPGIDWTYRYDWVHTPDSEPEKTYVPLPVTYHVAEPVHHYHAAEPVHHYHVAEPVHHVEVRVAEPVVVPHVEYRHVTKPVVVPRVEYQHVSEPVVVPHVEYHVSEPHHTHHHHEASHHGW